jgi:hypothetical protein
MKKYTRSAEEIPDTATVSRSYGRDLVKTVPIGTYSVQDEASDRRGIIAFFITACLFIMLSAGFILVFLLFD